MTTYPFGTYAAGWGTSFSAPLVSGTTALLVSLYSTQTSVSGLPLGLGNLSLTLAAPNTEPQVAKALTHTHAISDPQMGHGRLDTYQAMQAWSQSMGLN
jgi:subtilisin family serine protease